MWKTRGVFVSGLLVCGCLAIQVASRLAAQPNDSAGKSDNSSSQEQERKQELEMDVKYAKAYLRLTGATLDMYQDLNRRQPNTIPPSVMQVIQGGVADARDRVQLLEKGDLKETAICLAIAESELRAAQDSLLKAEQANRVAAGTVSGPQVELFKADVELAKVRVEKAGHLAAESPMSIARFELGQLREEMLQLQMFVALLRERN